MPGRLTVAGLRSAAGPGRGSTCCVDCGGRGNGWEDGGRIFAETTAARGGSVRGCDSLPPAVGGREASDPSIIPCGDPEVEWVGEGV